VLFKTGRGSITHNGRMMARIIFFLILIFPFYSVGNAIAGKGEPTSPYKWSYNHLDGYVTERDDYWDNNYGVKQKTKYSDGQNAERQNIYKFDLQINAQFFFSHRKLHDKAWQAGKFQ
jgi:hypothetical protein